MVYKKIINNIPSLSSLLLAGMVFGGCQDDKPEARETTTEAKVKEVESGVGDAKDAIKKSYRNDDLKKYAKSMFQFLVNNCSGLDHLKTSPIVSLTTEDIEGSDIKSKLELLFKSFASAPYTNCPTLRHLGDLDFASLKEKVACMHAGQAIVNVYSELSEIFRAILDEVGIAGNIEKADELLTRIEKLYVKLAPSTGASEFRDAKSFNDLEKAKAFPGPQMARFLKNPKHGMDALLMEPLGSVWVKLKNNDNAPIVGDLARNPVGAANNVTADLVQRRGNGISIANHEWKVKGDKNTTMPIIPAIANGENLVNAANQPVQHHADDVKMADLLFGQLLFTIFKGNEDVDCFLLERVSDSIVDFTVKKDSFSALLASAKGDKDAFAEYIGTHIEKNVSDILVVATGYERLIKDLREIEKQCREFPATNGAGNDANAPAIGAENPVGFMVGDPVVRVFNAILKAANPINHPNNNVGAICMDFQELGGLAANANTIQGSFMKKLCAKMAARFMHGGDLRGLAISNVANSAGPLISAVIYQINVQVNQAIVKKEEGKYLSTEISEALAGKIVSLANKIAKKNGARSITYGKLKEQTRAKFDIDKVLVAMKKDTEDLKALLMLNVDNVLSIEADRGKVDYNRFFNLKGLLKSHYPGLDNIRLEYVKLQQEKQKEASTAPAA